jgi:hypothetical protein
MNNRHRLVARLKAKEQQYNIRKIKCFNNETVKKVTDIFSAMINLIGEALEFYGTGIAKIGKSIQGKENDTLMNNLTPDEWIALSRYIRGDLYIGGANEGREEQIELFRSAAIKIIRIGDVLEGDQL